MSKHCNSKQTRLMTMEKDKTTKHKRRIRCKVPGTKCFYVACANEMVHSFSRYRGACLELVPTGSHHTYTHMYVAS